MNRERRKLITEAQGLVEEAKALIEQAMEEEQAARDALPENLQESAQATAMEDHIENLETLRDDIENLDFDQLGSGK